MEKTKLSNSQVLPIAHAIIWAGASIACAINLSSSSANHWILFPVLGTAVVMSLALHDYCKKRP